MQTNLSGPTSRPYRARTARDLGAAVRHFRRVNGLSQAELASRVGLHRTYLTELENGRATEALERLMSLFTELGVCVSLAREE